MGGDGIKRTLKKISGTRLTDSVSARECERELVETVESSFAVRTCETVPEGGYPGAVRWLSVGCVWRLRVGWVRNLCHEFIAPESDG